MDIANLSFRTFAHGTEDPAKVERALRFVSGAETVTRSSSTGYYGNPIIVMEAKISDSKHIKALLRSLGPRSLTVLLDTLDLRMDDDSFFYFRLDKQEAFQERYVLANGEDVIAVKGKVKSYPQSRENAMTSMEHLLGSEIERATKGTNR